MIGVSPTTAWMWGGRDDNGYCPPGAWSLDIKPVTSSAFSSTSAFALLADDTDSENLMSPSLYARQRAPEDRSARSNPPELGTGNTNPPNNIDGGVSESDGDVFSDDSDSSMPHVYAAEHTQRLMQRRHGHHHDVIYRRNKSTGSASEISDDGALASEPPSPLTAHVPTGVVDASGYLTVHDLTPVSEMSSSEMTSYPQSPATPTAPVSPLHLGGSTERSLDRMTLAATPTQQSPATSVYDATLHASRGGAGQSHATPIHPHSALGSNNIGTPSSSHGLPARNDAGQHVGSSATVAPHEAAPSPNLNLWQRMVQEIGVTPGKINWVAGDLLGRGAYGNVYKCFNRDNGTFFAAKRLSFGVLREHEMRLIVSEITTLQGVSHPHIVRCSPADVN